VNAIARRYAGDDYGSAHMHSRGVLVREDRSNPDAPNRTVRGQAPRRAARDACARHISYAQWHAAEAFRNDLAAAGGARLEANEAGIWVAASIGRYGPTERQIDALGRVRGRCRRLGSRSAAWCRGW
jgi:hypothetical protein